MIFIYILEFFFTRNLALYQACQMTNHLVISSTNLIFELSDQLESQILNPALWLVGEHEVYGGYFELIGDVTILVYTLLAPYQNFLQMRSLWNNIDRKSDLIEFRIYFELRNTHLLIGKSLKHSISFKIQQVLG